jgi:HEAT repeat protein
MLRAPSADDRLAALALTDAAHASEVVACAADADPEIRAAALVRLAELPDAAPAALVADALDAAEPAVRAAALQAAGRLPDAVHPGRLAAALRDPAATVRAAAIDALVAIGDAGSNAAFPFLADASERTATAALTAVARGSHPGRRQALAEELRRRVERAWQAVAGTRLLPAEGDLDTRFLHAAAADALLRHHRVAFHALALLESSRVVRRVERALDRGSPRSRGDALEVLSNLGDREAARLLVLMHEHAPLGERVAALGPGFVTAASREAFCAQVTDWNDPWLNLALHADAGGVGDTGARPLMERILALKRVPLFEKLSLDQLDAIAQLARDTDFVPGEVMMREGDAGGELFLLLEGRAEAWLDYGGEAPRRLRTIEAGEYIGEIAILDDAPRSATVVVVEASRALALDGDSLKALVMQMPEIAFELLRVMTARVRESERRMLESEE